MSAFVLILLTGLGLGALYFLIASGLSLIYGLMGVLNFAHGAFLTVGACVGIVVSQRLATVPSTPRFLLAVVAAVVAAAVVAALTELLLIRPLYGRHVAQVLVTVGLALAAVALVTGIYGTDPRPVAAPGWATGTTTVLGAHVPDNRFLAIGVALAVLLGLLALLRFTRLGLVIRAGVENRAMVTALGIDVRTAFTIVFAIGGAAAGLAGAVGGVYFGSVSPSIGGSLLIFAFIVVVIGGLGSLPGSALAAAVVGLFQQLMNYYAGGIGDLTVVLLLAAVLLVRPQGLLGRAA